MSRRGKSDRKPKFRPARTAGFTLVELLIVVIILGILAAIVIPQFSSSSQDAKLSAMVHDLEVVRKQIAVFRLQHKGVIPTLVNFEDLLTGKSDEDGTTNAAGQFGPYLDRIPPNPFTDNQNSVDDGAVGTSAWYYDEMTGEFRANCHNSHTTY